MSDARNFRLLVLQIIMTSNLGNTHNNEKKFQAVVVKFNQNYLDLPPLVSKLTEKEVKRL